MRQFSITRKGLRDAGRRIDIARQGHEILEKQQATLMQELMEAAEDSLKAADRSEDAAIRARRALARAYVEAGPEAVRSATLAAQGELEVEIAITDIMGARVPDIQRRSISRPMHERGYAIMGTSTTIDEASEAFEAYAEAILELAQEELRLRWLASELQRISRHVNALEHIVVPQLQEQQDYIRLALEERERAERSRLRLVKRLKEDRKTSYN
jgi:V/A-type H+-transporting ATPase subunit D